LAYLADVCLRFTESVHIHNTLEAVPTTFAQLLVTF